MTDSVIFDYTIFSLLYWAICIIYNALKNFNNSPIIYKICDLIENDCFKEVFGSYYCNDGEIKFRITYHYNSCQVYINDNLYPISKQEISHILYAKNELQKNLRKKLRKKSDLLYSNNSHSNKIKN